MRNVLLAETEPPVWVTSTSRSSYELLIDALVDHLNNLYLKAVQNIESQMPKKKSPSKALFGLVKRHNIIMLTLCCRNHNTKAILLLLNKW